MNNMDVIDNTQDSYEKDTFQLKTLGEFLRFYREQKQFSLEELSFKTKIRIHQLMYLEENDFTKLPNKIYLRGFIKSICNELQISAEMALAYLNDIEFKEEAYEFLTPIAPIVPRAQEKESKRVTYKQREEMSSPYYGPKYFDLSKVNQKLVFGGTALLLLSVTFIGSIHFKTNHVAETSTHKKMNYFEAKKLEAGEPVTNLAPPANEVAVVENAPVAAVAVAQQTQTAPTTVAAVKAGPPALVIPKQTQEVAPVVAVVPAPVQVVQQVHTTTAPIAKAAVAVSAPIVKIAPKVAAKPAPRVIAVTPKPVAVAVTPAPAAIPVAETEVTQPAQAAATQTEAVAESENLKINIVAKKGDVFVVYRINGGEKLRALIKKGKSMSLEGSNIRMNVGNPDAVEITKNGESVDVKPEAGKGSAHLKFSVKE